MSDSTHIALPSLTAVPEMKPASLSGVERITVPFLTWLNTRVLPKRLIQVFVKHFSRRWVAFVTRPRWQLTELEPLTTLVPDSSVLLVSNHRSFFDMYVACAILYERTPLLDRLYFPVRKNFWYDHPLGFLVNLGISGGAMWPPVFRDERRGDLNPVGVEQMIHVLQHKGTAIGIHPEGTRGKGDDPYELLPPRPGVGKLVAGCPDETLIVPFFTVGLSNSFLAEVKARFFGGGAPIRIRWGEPIRAGELRHLETSQQLSEHLHGVILDLATAERDNWGGV